MVKVVSIPENCHNISLIKRGARYTAEKDVQMLCWLASRQKGNILEIGCNEGVTTCDLAACFPHKIIYAVDYVNKDLCLLQEQQHEQPEPATFCRYVKDAANVRKILCKSSELEGSQFEDIGCIFIDGDHSYEGVSRDTSFALSYLQKRGEGVVIWHDYYERCPKWVGVKKYLDEFLSITYENVMHIENTWIAFLEIGNLEASISAIDFTDT